MDIDDAVLGRLDEAFAYAAPQGFRPMGRWAERHGHWEVRFHRPADASDALGRFVSVKAALIQLYRIEIRIGCHDQSRMVDRPFAQFSKARAEILNGFAPSSQ